MLLLPLIGLIGLVPAPPQEGGPQPPTPVIAQRAVERSVVPRHLVTGSLAPAYEARVGAREGGALLAVPARAGVQFAKGDVLAELDAERLRAERTSLGAQRAVARAEKVRAGAEEEAAREDLEATRVAAERGALSEREVRDALARARVAQAELDAAQARIESLDAQLALLEVRLADTRVLAPFDGTVVEQLVEVGEWVTAGDPVCVLVATKEFEVRLDVPERLLPGAMGLDGTLEVELRATGARFSATNVRAVPRVDPTTRTFRVLADVTADADAPLLGPGMSVACYLPGGAAEPAVTIPKDALVYRPSGITVTVVQGLDEGGDKLTGAAVSLPVEILFEVDREVALVPGVVAAGDVVVVEGNERLRPGSTVAATIRSAPAAPR